MSVRPTIDPACSTSDAPAPMIAAVIDARPRDIGFKVRRLLPSRARPLVRPFILALGSAATAWWMIRDTE